MAASRAVAVETAAPPSPPAAVQATPFRASAAPFSDDDQLLVEVRVGRDQITDALAAYSSRSGVYLPLGEFARDLDLAITVYPAEQNAKGWVLRENHTVSVDIRTRTARLDDQTIPIGPDQAAFHADEIYLRMDLVEKLLPIDLKFDSRGLILYLQPREPLPFQQRLERERRRREIGGFTDKVSVMKVATPYLAVSPPAFDLTFNGASGLANPNVTGQYDVRAAGDLAYGSMQLFAGSDLKGHLNDVRFTLGRRDYTGHLLGPLKGTDLEAGDTFSPSLSLGERSSSGRGVSFGSGSLAAGSVFSHLDLRGELQDGWQVELYVNEVLQASQTTASQGRYEFLNVPLSYGANTLRLVFYGPHGEQREEVRHYTFGSGQLDKGKLVLNFGAVQEGENVVQLPTPLGPNGTPTPKGIGQGTFRAAAEVQYGLTRDITVVGGFAQYTPVSHDTRRILEGGLRTSVHGMALQVDAAKDLDGGEALGFNLAGRMSGISFVARDSEYQGVFYDETQRSGLTLGDPLRRSTEVRLDWVERAFKIGSGIPMELDVQSDERQDGSTITTANARFSASPGGLMLASTLGYSGSTSPSSGASNAFSGELEVSRLFGANWQVRGGLQYQLVPTPQPQSLFVNLDHALSKNNSLRLSVSQSLTGGLSSSVQLSDTWRLSRASLAFSAGFDSQQHDFRAGVQLSFGLAFDPARGGYRIVRPGATTGGDVAFEAFIDSNGDGRREAGEGPVPNLPLQSQGPEVKTDADGRALLTGIGASGAARIRVKTDALDEPYSVPPADVVEFTPRPGRVTQVFYGLKPVGEVQLKLLLHKPDGKAKGVSGLDVQLLSKDNVVVSEGRTEYDGTMFVEKLPPGVYTVRIEPGQSQRLGLGLAAAMTVRIPPNGGYAGNIEGQVVAHQ